MLDGRPLRHVAGAALVALIATVGAPSRASAQVMPMSDTAVKAALLYNFAKFTEWHAPSGHTGPITLCVMGDARVAGALEETVRAKRLDGRDLHVRHVALDDPVGVCDVLFVPASEMRRAASVLSTLGAQPVLTVSDGKDFAHTGGIIELFVEGGRLRFAINTDAASRARLQLSSRLLGLAKIVKDHGAR